MFQPGVRKRRMQTPRIMIHRYRRGALIKACGRRQGTKTESLTTSHHILIISVLANGTRERSTTDRPLQSLLRAKAMFPRCCGESLSGVSAGCHRVTEIAEQVMASSDFERGTPRLALASRGRDASERHPWKTRGDQACQWHHLGAYTLCHVQGI